MRYVKIPLAVTLKSFATERTIDGAQPVTFGDSIRAICSALVTKGSLDALSVLDLRQKLASAKVGEIVELPDEWWNPLANEFRRPSNMTPDWVFSARSHIEAVVHAFAERGRP
jgi:hypothetical protein